MPSTKLLKNLPPETVVGDIGASWLEKIWLSKMRGLAPPASEIISLMQEAVEDGALQIEEMDAWLEAMKHCPVGGPECDRDMHVGRHSWCAYCGDINADNCLECGEWLTEWDNPHELLQMRTISDILGPTYAFCPRCQATEPVSCDMAMRADELMRLGIAKAGGVAQLMKKTGSIRNLADFVEGV